MAIAVIMPRQGQSVESCIISKWMKQKGDSVASGDVLFTYETDKAAFEEESQIEGILLEVFFQEGDDVPVLTNVCVIGQKGEDISEFLPSSNKAALLIAQVLSNAVSSDDINSIASSDANDNTSFNEAASTGIISVGEGFKISPRARNLATKMRLNESRAIATGPEGRIIERDILALAEKEPGATLSAAAEYRALKGVNIQGTGIGGRVVTEDIQGFAITPKEDKNVSTAQVNEYEEVKLSNIRKVIAKAMHQSLSNSAQLTLHASFDATAILSYRKLLKTSQEGLGLNNITLNDMVIYAVSRTLLNHSNLNAHFFDDKMHIYHNVHLGVAVDTERGLMVPTLYNANLKSLNQMASEIKALAKTCQEGSINPDNLKGGTFTVTNLGQLDIEMFTPILNPPQTGILGVNTIVYRVKVTDGEMVAYPAMGLSLTFDHRAVDGAPAARFLKELKNNLENFTTLLSK